MNSIRYWLIFFLEIWQVKAKCTHCQVKCGQAQPGGEVGKACSLGGQWYRGTITNYSHTLSVGAGAEGNLKGWGVRLLVQPGGLGTWSVFDFCNAFLAWLTEGVHYWYRSSQALKRHLLSKLYVCKFLIIPPGECQMEPIQRHTFRMKWSSMMKNSWVSDSSCLEKLKALVGQTLREISGINVLFYILIVSGLHKGKTLSKLNQCTIKTESSFFIRRNTVNKY